MTSTPRYAATVGSQHIELPVVALREDLAIALLICVDHGVAFTSQAGVELAAILADRDIEIVASVATMGIPLAIEVTRSLGLDDYLVLHKTQKIHLGDSFAEPLTSITTAQSQRLRMDPARAEVVRGRRVAVVDDVISTGASIRAALSLLRKAGAEPVAVGAFAAEGTEWRSVLGSDAEMVCTLGSIPTFRIGAGGEMTEQW